MALLGIPLHCIARPITFSSPDPATGKSNKYAFNRNVGYVGTFFHFVAQGRANNPAGGIIWFGVDDASLSVRVPMYSVTSAAPETWKYGNGATGASGVRMSWLLYSTAADVL